MLFTNLQNTNRKPYKSPILISIKSVVSSILTFSLFRLVVVEVVDSFELNSEVLRSDGELANVLIVNGVPMSGCSLT